MKSNLRKLIQGMVILCYWVAMFTGCSGKKSMSGDIVDFQFCNSVNHLFENVASIDIIPLKTDEEHLLGSNVDLTLAGDDFIVSDCTNGNIFRYSADGRFLNNIGRKGNGPGEYAHINNVQYYNKELYVFSVPSKIQRFSLEGELIDSEMQQEAALGDKSWKTNDGILTCYGYGYGSGRGYRFALIGDETKNLYPSEEKVINFTPTSNIFSENGDTLFIVDSYSNVIKKYFQGEMSDGISFNFGKYSIPDSFFKADDAFFCDGISYGTGLCYDQPIYVL